MPSAAPGGAAVFRRAGRGRGAQAVFARGSAGCDGGTAERRGGLCVRWEAPELRKGYAVTAATLPEWRDAFLAVGAEGPKIRQEDLVEEQGRRMKSAIAELDMENELLREHIRRREDERRFPG